MRPVRKIIFVFLFLIHLSAWSQQAEIKGMVGRAKDRLPLSGANIINLTQLTGTISNTSGYFRLPAAPGDTLLISFLGYKTFKMKVDSSDFAVFHKIFLQQEPIVLQEIVIKSHELTGVLPVDLALIPVRKPPKVDLHLDLLFGDTTANAFTRLNDNIRKISDPVGMLYNFFSAHGKDIRKLKRLKERDQVYAMLTRRFDRKILSELLHIPPEDVYRVLQWCDYDEHFLRNASDMQILEALKQCYERHRPVMEGE